jgi:Spy/CpxP family protein refolding chaperone
MENEEEMSMRKFWTRTLAVCLLSMATLAVAGVWAQQESPTPANPPDEAAPPSGSGRAGRGGNVENRLEMMSKQLNLTDAQKEKIRPILKHEMERMREIRNNTSLSQAEARQRMATVRRNTREHIAEVLTPEQKKQWRETQQERRGGGGPEGGQGGPGTSGPTTPPPSQTPPNPN